MIRQIVVLFLAIAVAATATATTFVVSSDRHLVIGTGAIVVARVVTSNTQLSDEGAIETVTTVEVDDVLKGTFKEKTLKVYEPGGRYGEMVQAVAGVPRFRDGERVILFVNKTKGDRQVVHNLALGKFSVAKDRDGRSVALRQEAEINGWTVDGRPHQERRRDAAKFIAFIRAVVAGKEADEQGHFIPLGEQPEDRKAGFEIETHDTFAASTYLFSQNIRWSSFPRSYTYSNTLTGASSGGVDAIVSALGLWTNDTESNVSITNGGLDATKTNGVLGSADGGNAIFWERDLSAIGAPAYICGVGGVLGVGSIRSSGSHSGPGGVTFSTAFEGDVDMNQGLADCASLFDSTVFVNALSHEIGHTLGFRHADQNRDGDFPCPGETQECVPAPQDPDDGPHAVMRSSLPFNLPAALQTYDINAVRAVYPNPAITVNPPTGVLATPTSGTSVSVTWAASPTATGYRVMRSTNATTFAQVGSDTGEVTTFTDTTATAGVAYLYLVRGLNSGVVSSDSNKDLATPMNYTDATLLIGMTLKAAHVTELRSAVNAVRGLAGLGAFSFTDPVLSGVHAKVVHLTELRSALAAALSALSLSTPTYSEPTITTSTTIKRTHITELRTGMM